MKRQSKGGIALLFMFFACIAVYGQKKLDKFPYSKQGLNKEDATIHLLNRFTYGYNMQDIQDVQKEGLEVWFIRQLQGKTEDKSLNGMLEPYKDAMLDNQTISEKYPRSVRVRRMMLDEGFIDKDSVLDRSPFYRRKFREYMDQKGFKPEQELYRKFIASKALRAAFSVNQLREVMTDFWFNHFNVSFTKPSCAPFIPSYENHVIRPNALGKFEDLLLQTAKSPAMLQYLDNVSSVADNPNAKTKRGINENYARELMELHTLGVDGGYTQKDISEVARILTGWTSYPMNGFGNQNIIRNRQARAYMNNIIDGDFVFVANNHDKGTKVVMGETYSNNGYDEGVQLISFLSGRPQTAQFISRKLAIRFVNDNPSTELVDKMAQVFLKTKGDIKSVLITMVQSSEFWDKQNVNTKVKTPFELAISSVRALDGTITNPGKLINWVTRMGEKKYYYIAPTGYPDKSSYWINTGSLLNRMNFGLSFVDFRASGVDIDLLKVNSHREPESAEQALEMYARILLPKSDLATLTKRLSPLLTAQNLKQKVEKSSGGRMDNDMEGGARRDRQQLDRSSNNAMLAQVVGLIIGSPEFQRR